MGATTTHAEHRFSITVQSGDTAVVSCLRALADHSQLVGNKRIAWGGTKEEDWKRQNRSVTFRFTDPKFRDRFVAQAQRFLPVDLWTVVSTRNDDPATPQR